MRSDAGQTHVVSAFITCQWCAALTTSRTVHPGEQPAPKPIACTMNTPDTQASIRYPQQRPCGCSRRQPGWPGRGTRGCRAAPAASAGLQVQGSAQQRSRHEHQGAAGVQRSLALHCTAQPAANPRTPATSCLAQRRLTLLRLGHIPQCRRQLVHALLQQLLWIALGPPAGGACLGAGSCCAAAHGAAGRGARHGRGVRR